MYNIRLTRGGGSKVSEICAAKIRNINIKYCTKNKKRMTKKQKNPKHIGLGRPMGRGGQTWTSEPSQIMSSDPGQGLGYMKSYCYLHIRSGCNYFVLLQFLSKY